MTKREAAQRMVERDFSAIPTALVSKAYPYGEGITDLTPLEGNSDIGDIFFPRWGTMWLVDESVAARWIYSHREQVSECGFFIYKIEEGLLLVIDGGGYDFYEEHWLPLYDAMGLMWHENKRFV